MRFSKVSAASCGALACALLCAPAFGQSAAAPIHYSLQAGAGAQSAPLQAGGWKPPEPGQSWRYPDQPGVYYGANPGAAAVQGGHLAGQGAVVRQGPVRREFPGQRPGKKPAAPAQPEALVWDQPAPNIQSQAALSPPLGANPGAPLGAPIAVPAPVPAPPPAGPVPASGVGKLVPEFAARVFGKRPPMPAGQAPNAAQASNAPAAAPMAQPGQAPIGAPVQILVAPQYSPSEAAPQSPPAPVPPQYGSAAAPEVNIALASPHGALAPAPGLLPPLEAAPDKPAAWQDKPRAGPPYQIAGKWYVPTPEPGHNETGIASWYGPDFHGKLTATGEIFDMTALSAAHPTLPIPSLVQVTNLENGREAILRLNDRGPFAKGRAIDVSKRAAEVLGFEKQGQARVQVRYLGPAPKRLVDKPVLGLAEQIAPAPQAAARAEAGPVLIAPLADLPPIAGKAPAPDAKLSGLFVQAGAFADFSNAHRLRERLNAIKPTAIAPIPAANAPQGKELFRVLVGPFLSQDDAKRALQDVVAAGQSAARIVDLP